MSNILISPDEWEAPSGSLANLAAEAVAAEITHARDATARWYGGNTRGADIRSALLRVDAKRVTVHLVDGVEMVRLVRRNGRLFDPAAVDVLCLVHIVDSVAAATVDADSSVVLSYRGRAADVWWVPVDEMNQILSEFEPGEFRHVDVERSLLDAYPRPDEAGS